MRIYTIYYLAQRSAIASTCFWPAWLRGGWIHTYTHRALTATSQNNWWPHYVTHSQGWTTKSTKCISHFTTTRAICILKTWLNISKVPIIKSNGHSRARARMCVCVLPLTNRISILYAYALHKCHTHMVRGARVELWFFLYCWLCALIAHQCITHSFRIADRDQSMCVGVCVFFFCECVCICLISVRP